MAVNTDDFATKTMAAKVDTVESAEESVTDFCRILSAAYRDDSVHGVRISLQSGGDRDFEEERRVDTYSRVPDADVAVWFSELIKPLVSRGFNSVTVTVEQITAAETYDRN